MHSLFIVEGRVKDWFNSQAEAMGNDGLAVASLCLSKSGKEPGTHGWCGVQLDPAQAAAVAAVLAANPKESKGIDWTQYDIGTAPDWPDAQLARVKLKLIQAKP